MENQQQSEQPIIPQVPIGMQPALPNATAALVLGIISIPTCFCAGLIGLTAGIIAIVLGSKAIKLYRSNPSAYTISSYNNANAGKICGIIGTVLSALYLLYVAIYLLFVGTLMTSVFTAMPWGDVK
jgi:M penetrans paralogue family 26